MNDRPEIQTLGESERYAIWLSVEPDSGEEIYHIEFDNVTVHLFADEWEEFIDVVMQAMR
jgi:hypothetical protein